MWDKMGWQLLSQDFCLGEKSPRYEFGELGRERKSSLANQTRGRGKSSRIVSPIKKKKYKMEVVA